MTSRPWLALLIVCIIASMLAGPATWVSGSRATAAPGSSPPSSAEVGLDDVGAVCDGAHDDRASLAKAVRRVARAGGGTVWVPARTCRIVATAGHPSIELPTGVVIRGRSSKSRLDLASDVETDFRQLFKVTGDHVALRRLTLTRDGSFPSVMIALEGSKGFTMRKVTMDGRQKQPAASDVSGIMLQPQAGTAIEDVTLSKVVIRRFDYGLFQPSTVVGTIDGLYVRRSSFRANRADDLEFNAPMAMMRDVRVTGSTFERFGRESAQGSGFAVGLANVSRARVIGNTFRGYPAEPVHIEDRSRKVWIHRNRFRRSGTAETNYAAHVLVVGVVRHVWITRNMFDTSVNSNSHTDCVHLGGGGLPIGPDRVLVARNRFRLGTQSDAVGHYLATEVTVVDNVVQRARARALRSGRSGTPRLGAR